MNQPAQYTDQQKDSLLRWRLVLGKKAQELNEELALEGLGSGWERVPDMPALSGVDACLSFVYDEGDRSAGLGRSSPYIPKWLGKLREYFAHDTVALVQKDAIEKKGLTRLLFEPETMVMLERNVDLVATLVAMKDLVPDRAKQAAREIIRDVVEEIRKRLENDVRQAVVGALRRNRYSPIAVAKNIDWKRTIRRNLKNYDPERKIIIPERFYFWANELRMREWSVIILVDQSGSMGPSVVYSSIMAAIFASLGVLRTRLAFFDTAIVDVTENLHDPVDIIFGAQLGCGTDIARAVAYGAGLVERPDRTIFVLITDLFEGGNQDALLNQLEALVESKVTCLTLLALNEGGVPAFNHELATQTAARGVHTFGCTPKKLTSIMERILQGKPFNDLTSEAKK
jgi:hypothetical protein